MAIAERWLAAHFNQAGDKIVDYRVYSICSDGDMMEGLSHESAALAGHLKLSNLIWLYDFNHISLDGPTTLAYSDDVESRFKGYHWNVLTVEDANDLGQVEAAIREAHRETARPTLIIVHSPHRLRLAPQAGHERGTRRTAGRRGSEGHQALLRMARRCAVPDPERGGSPPGPSRGARQESSKPTGRQPTRSGRKRILSWQSSGMES